MRLLALIVALSFVLAACIGSDDDPTATPQAATPTVEAATQPPSEPEPTATSEPEPEADPTATDEPEADPTAIEAPDEPTAEPDTGDDNAELELLIQEIAEQTAELRGLPLLEPIQSEILSREDLRDNMLEMLEDDYGQEGADLDRDLLWMLRLIPDRGLDYFQLYVDLYTEQVAGYYDPETGELVVIGEGSTLTADQKVTMSHEIVHALQDQHFGLDLYDDDTTDFDRVTAFQAVVEGDATWTMVQWAITHLSMEEIGEFLAAGADTDTTTLDNAPRYVQESLVFPYNAGFQFVEALIASGGLDAVDAALADPPTSTEQILYPERFLSEPRDEPMEVSIPELNDTLGNGWEQVYDGTLGVFDLAILLEENGVSNSQAPTMDWGGTSFVMYENADDLLTVLSTQWNTEDAASTFNDALLQTLDTYDQDGEFRFDGDRYHATFHNGDAVVIITSTNRDALTAALGTLQTNTP